MNLFTTNCRKHCLHDVIMKEKNSIVVVMTYLYRINSEKRWWRGGVSPPLPLLSTVGLFSNFEMTILNVTLFRDYLHHIH
jgi:hypothetical protein